MVVQDLEVEEVLDSLMEARVLDHETYQRKDIILLLSHTCRLHKERLCRDRIFKLLRTPVLEFLNNLWGLETE